jgi:ABC-2 type transport system ATP-binding protein
MNEFVVETHELTKRYGSILAVDRLSIQVSRGGVFGLLGPNGSGKTTIMSMLLGLVAPTSGTFRLLGHESNGGLQEALHDVGATAESPAFYPYLSGRANLQYFQGIIGRGDSGDIERLLKLAGLSDRAHSKFSTYSQGMKQRLSIAYALLGNPHLLFLDEPTNGLDPAGLSEVRELIRRLSGEGHSILLSSHLLHEVQQVCDRVAIMSRGRLIAQGAIRDLLRRRGAVRLTTTDDARAIAIISALAWVTAVSAENGYITAEAPPERSWELTKALAEHSVAVKEMAPVEDSLERYFLEVTGDDSPSRQGETG